MRRVTPDQKTGREASRGESARLLGRGIRKVRIWSVAHTAQRLALLLHCTKYLKIWAKGVVLGFADSPRTVPESVPRRVQLDPVFHNLWCSARSELAASRHVGTFHDRGEVSPVTDDVRVGPATDAATIAGESPTRRRSAEQTVTPSSKVKDRVTIFATATADTMATQ